MSTLVTILIGILGLSFLIFFHETGHFVTARIFKVKVEAFSVGMGPVLLHKTVKGTDYRLSAIPLGGYCAMKGEKDYQEALEDGSPSIRGDKDSFYGIHPFKRLLISFAGPFFNLIFAFIAFFVISLVGYTYFSAGCQVDIADEIYEDVASPAHQAGLVSGDTILKVNGKSVSDFSEIVEAITVCADEDIELTVDREGSILDFTVHSIMDKDTGAGKIGIVSRQDSVAEREYPRHSFFASFPEAFRQTGNMIYVLIKGLSSLFKGLNITKAVSGPVSISSMLGEAAIEGFHVNFRIGMVNTLQILAIISISLFFTNLLPVPVLDGGLILFSLIEIVTRRKISPKVLKYIQMAGIAIIALLFILAIVGDIQYFIKR